MMDEDQLYVDLAPVCEGFGVQLVDCRLQGLKTGIVCQVIITATNGVGTDDCAKVYRAVMPRLEILLDRQDVTLEVSSPGIDRKVRMTREYHIFKGRGISLLLKDQSIISGIITDTNETTVTIQTTDNVVTVLLVDIQKAKLDFSQEVR